MEEENKPQESDSPETVEKQNKLIGFLANVLRGVAIGVAFIIPGFSGGSVAAILGIYEKLVSSVADLFKKFKQSIAFLFPVLLGMILGIAALILPIQWGIRHYPIPTVTLFVGLALGGLPSVTEKLKGGRFSWKHAAACLVPLIAAAALCFLPHGDAVDLFHLNFGGYLLLVLMGFIASCALVVPGISGSMLLLIFGYYNPIVELVTKKLFAGYEIGICILVLFCVAIGIVAGFFGISVLMRYLLKKFPRGTYCAIVGFIVGSIPAVYFSTAGEAGLTPSTLPASPWYWIVSVLLLFAGIALSYLLVCFARKKNEKPDPSE